MAIDPPQAAKMPERETRRGVRSGAACPSSQHFYDDIRQGGEFLTADRECRGEIDDRTKRTNKYACVDKPRAQLLQLCNAVEFDHADRAPDPHLPDAGQCAARSKAALQCRSEERRVGKECRARWT